MDKIKKFFTAVLGYIKSRGIGFWLLLPVAVLSIVIPFVYKAQFGSTPEYWSTTVMILPIFAFIAFALSFCKYTAKYAPVAMFALSLAGMLMFVNTIYYYIADIIFKADDVSIGGIFRHSDAKVIFILIAYFINILLCVAAAFFKQYRTKKDKTNYGALEVQS